MATTGARPRANSQAAEAPAARNTLRYILLGLLAARPMTGYDIKQRFDAALAYYWNADRSQIYSALKALTAEGLAEPELVVQDGRPNRKLYVLTEAGRAELARWLGEGVPERYAKDEFLAKLFFLGHGDSEAARLHLEQHRADLLRELAHLEAVKQEYAQRPARRPQLLAYQLLVRDYNEARLRADLAVTERALARLAAGELPTPSQD